MALQRQSRVHWNAATAYPNMAAHLMDMFEGTRWDSLPTDLCLLILEWVGEKLDACLPLPAGSAQLQLPIAGWRGTPDAIQLRSRVTNTSYELPFHGGGFLSISGPLFEQETVRTAWYALPRTIISTNLKQQWFSCDDESDARRSRPAAAGDGGDDDLFDERPPKRQRVDKAVDPRWSIHQQSFAYYQVTPCGMNLLRDPSSPTTIGLVSGVSLVFARQERREGSSTRYGVEDAIALPLTGPDHLVKTYFRAPGVCEWSTGLCSRRSSDRCANACCSDEHCMATVRGALCPEHD